MSRTNPRVKLKENPLSNPIVTLEDLLFNLNLLYSSQNSADRVLAENKINLFRLTKPAWEMAVELLKNQVFSIDTRIANKSLKTNDNNCLGFNFRSFWRLLSDGKNQI